MSKKRNFRKMLGLFALVWIIVAVGACSSAGAGPGSKESSKKSELKISHHPYLHALPSVYAEKHGLYDAFNYTISYYSGGPTQNEAIASDAWEVGTTGTGGSILGASGYNLKTIGFTCTDSNTVDLWVRPDSPMLQAPQDSNGIYGTANDWKGKKILCPTGTSCHMVLIGTLEHLGLKQDDVTVVDMSVAQSYPAFKAGEGDMVALWSPFGFAAQKEGWVKISSAKMLGINLPCLIVATEKAVKERPEVVQAWLQAYMDSEREMLKDKKAAADLLFDFEKREGIKMDAEVATLEVETRPFESLENQKALFKKAADGKSEAEKILITFADFLISQGKLTEADKQKMLDNNFVDGSFIEKVN